MKKGKGGGVLMSGLTTNRKDNNTSNPPKLKGLGSVNTFSDRGGKVGEGWDDAGAGGPRKA